MSLTEYRRKREFSKTREPEPGKPLPKGKRAIFVVQLHHASRRHYDFRLQVGDALKSWAVPKGPSFDPNVKRLAAEVEDHPVDYAGFEGEIPAGEYGGGHVALFDRGVWATSGNPEEQLAKGHLRFELFGDKLKGGWHLVRSGKPARQPQWLLFKDKDRYAGEREADDMLADVTPDPRKADAGKSTKKSTVATKATAAANKATKAPAQPAKATKKATKKAPAKAAAAPKARARGKRADWAAEAAALPGARRRRLADAPFEPQLARLGDAPPPGDAWLHEAKWDGYRLVSVVRGGTPRIWSRNALEWTQKVPEIAAALEQLGVEEVALDGELIAGGGTQADFGLLQATLSGEASGQLSYVLFDILHLDGVDIGGVPQLARKELLERLLAGAAPPLRYSSHVAGHGDEAYAHANEAGLEGIISKRATAPYRGGRGDDWRKTKHLLSDEFAVVGFTAPKGSRSGFGSLLLARPAGDGGWRYAGRVGSGFSDELLRSLSKALDRDTSTRPTVDVPEMDAALRSAKWLQPAAVVEVFYRGIGNGGLLRQPSLKGLRPDKAPADLADSDRSTPGKAGKAGKPGGTRTAKGKAGSPATAKAAGTSTRASRSTAAETAPAKKTAARANRGRGAIGAPPADEVQLSSPTRVVYPDVGVTKRGVFDYYAGIMDWLLPEIIDRPVSIVRCTQGVGRPCFFQKHHTPGLEGVGMARLKEESGTQAEYLVVRDARSILELVQFNAVEFHPWGAHAGSPDRADRIVFDLDPGPGVSWAEVVDAARKVRGLLEQLELESFLRTTGGKGLHVVVPLNPGCDWSLVKPFAQGFATTMAQVEPLKFVATATKKFRTGKIFIDYLRNGRGATSVASFSLRSREGAPIAMPLRWEELGRVKSGAAFDIVSGPKRMQRLKTHPWDGIDAVRQDLDKVGRLLAQHAPAKARRPPL